MNMTYQVVKSIVLIGIVLVITMLAVDFISWVKEYKKVSSTRTAILRTVPNDYLKLFNSQDTVNITNKFTELSSVRSPVSYFDYDRNKYCLIVTKIKLNNSEGFRQLIRETRQPIQPSMENLYFPISEKPFYFYYRAERADASSVVLNLSGDSIKMVEKQDSIAHYYFKMKGFSIQHDIKNFYDLSAESRDGMPAVCLSFVKNQGFIYIILMSANYDDKLQPESLKNLIHNSQ